MQGWGWQSVHHPLELPKVLEKWRYSIISGEPFEMVFPLKSAQGDYRLFLTRVIPLRNESGQITRWFGTNTDIEDSMQAQTELVDTMESMSDAFFSVDKNWQILRVNSHMEFLSGVPREAQVGKNLLEIYFGSPGSQSNPLWTQFHAVMENRAAVVFDAFYEPMQIWTEVRAYPKNDGGMAVFYTDITVRKKSQERLQMILDTFPIFGGLLAPDGTIAIVNQFAAEIMGRAKSEIIGKNFWECDWWETLPEISERVKSLVKTAGLGKAQRIDIEFMASMGGKAQIRWADVSLIPLFDENGNVENITATGFDITERVLQAKELKEAKLMAEQANKLKSAFLANMSHEIRTPLGAMIGFADLLKDTGLTDAERSSYLEVLTRNGHQLTHIINDILDLAKVESGQLKVESIKTEPISIAKEVIHLLGLNAKEKGLVLNLSLEKGVPPQVQSDPVRLRQILINIVGNAVKFTQAGQIDLRIFNFSDEKNRELICFEISDTGVGISEQDTGKLFRVFSQADTSITRKYGGTGLGLALSKKLAQALGGDVTLVKTNPGLGTTFRVTIAAKIVLPETLALPIVTPQPSPKSLNLKGVRVLLVEDSEDNQHLISQILKRHGVEVEISDNGADGVDKALKRHHDLVLMDIQMPVMDGYTATQRLREKGFEKPIIALTAHAMSEVRMKCLDVGCTDHLAKPIDFKELLEMVTRYTARSKDT